MTVSKDIMTMISIIEIQQLKARYAEYADAKYGPGHHRAPADKLQAAARSQADCFTEDARWEGGDGFGGDIIGRDALARFFANPPWAFASHFYASPVITVDRDRATAAWRLWQVAVPAEGEPPLFLFARTEERYRHTADGWLHDAVRFTSLDKVRAPAGMLRLEARA